MPHLPWLLLPIGDTAAQQTARSGPESWLLHSFDRHSCALRGCEDACVLDPDFERLMVWQGSLAATLGPGCVGEVVEKEQVGRWWSERPLKHAVQ